MFTLNRSEHNPLLTPVEEHPWEAYATFNGCPIVEKRKTYILYRAMSERDMLRNPQISTSVIGIASASDGIHFENRKVFFGPSEEFDQYGCEDPRVTKFDDTFYIFYTALGGYPFSADNIRVGVALSPDLKTITEKHLVTPFNAKAMALFPKKINGKMAALVTVNTDRRPSDICYIEFNKPEDIWSKEYWEGWMRNFDNHKINLRRVDSDQVEMGAPPLWTEKGWLVVYSHIQDYARDNTVFGIETVLLDLENPRRIIGRTKGSFMVPDAYYEKAGHVPNIIFPCGALIKKGHLEIYYGAADTHCAMASIHLDSLLNTLLDSKQSFFKRFPGNPIISPRSGVAWEAGGTLNPAAVELEGKIHIVYRATTPSNVSVLGYAVTKDGFKIDERLDEPIYKPRADFESRPGSDANYGCEDPRIVVIDDKLYMTYVAYNGDTPRVTVSDITIKNFLARNWDAWSEPHVITAPNIANKDATILPEKVNGKYLVIHRVGNGICGGYIPSLNFEKEEVDTCIEIINPRPGMWDGVKVGITGPPIKTKNGWLLLYHGVSKSSKYRVGAALLDLDDPTVVKSRTAVPVLEPVENYERNGLMSNVVFPCGLILRDKKLFLYYGAADSVIGVATIEEEDLLNELIK
jgi:predicted GH43/DUF377 family glycosyl hydrolase